HPQCLSGLLISEPACSPAVHRDLSSFLASQISPRAFILGAFTVEGLLLYLADTFLSFKFQLELQVFLMPHLNVLSTSC
ncbi:hypothetical protein LEMLEM_LOCUS7373, partial [Lemmus lemmus]